MKQNVRLAYKISLIAAVLLIVLFGVFETADEYIRDSKLGYHIIDDYEVGAYKDESAPAGITQEYRWTVKDVSKRNCAITFYVVHQEVEIYLDDELLYSLTPGKENLFSNDVGCAWARAYLYPQDEGRELRILIRPLYDSKVPKENTIYFGNFDSIYKSIIRESFPIMMASSLSIIVGLVFILFVIINRKNPEIDKSIASLGVFAIFTGLWKITDVKAAPLLINQPLFLSAIALISIIMMPVTYVYFIRNQFRSIQRKIIGVMGTICSIVSISIVSLQLLGIWDLKQPLIIVHAMILSVCLSMIFLFIWEFIHNSISKKLKITMICCTLCLAGTMVDMCMFYIVGDSGSTIFGILAFLFYTIQMGYMSLREVLYLMKRGKQANHYEQLAMHDPLTGIYSRVYFLQYVEKHKNRLNSCYVIMLDVNNLKQCNDTKGHTAGDKLLCNGAHIIEEVFLPDGRCIRLGGDEFCVIFRQSTEEEIKTYLKEFENSLECFNKEHPDDFPINIAYGYACFDGEKDANLEDTLLRADKKMYEMKYSMKHKKP